MTYPDIYKQFLKFGNYGEGNEEPLEGISQKKKKKKFNSYSVDTKLAREVRLEGNYFYIPSKRCQCEDGWKRDKQMC